MKFLKRILARWVREGSAEYYEEDRVRPGPPAIRNANGRGNSRKTTSQLFGDECYGDEFKNPMNITLYNATGGRIIKFSRWDSNRDETVETTYIVSSDENFEEALGKFIALEAMKHVE